MKVPNFIKPLDIDKEREAIISEFKTKSGKLDYTPLIGDDYMTLIDIFLFKLNNFIELTNVKISQNYLLFSKGEYLDELVKLIGIKRNEEIKPIAKVEIKVNSSTFLSKGTKFTDTKGHFAYLLKDIYVSDTAIVEIEAADYFKEPYETTTLEIPNIYITEINIKEPFSGFKSRESDDELRDRFLLALHRFSTAGSEKAYLFHVLSVEGINKASVYQLSAGVVQVIYLSKFEPQIAKEKIKEALKDKIPLTDDVRIKEANKINLDLVIEIAPKQNFMFNEILANADFRLKEFFNTLKINETPHISQLIEVAFDENTASVEVKTPIPVADRDSIIILNSLQINKANHA
ncbi:baseplate J/gp47 family protein [uncultured Campylobacter sp.]|uniref:baseplate J/gp47 family protein n=1 Tax=uncultured Campylobacter sp. TaxID=218934 RepID=UPI0026019CE4|nr:baseplate J/gp47 family protein [uncultured Campylobacter sp.]